MEDLKKLKAERAELDRQIAKAERYEKGLAADDACAIAELLHEHTCYSDHTDQCGWHYESWDPGAPAGNRTRMQYKAQAQKMIDICRKARVSIGVISKLIEVI